MCSRDPLAVTNYHLENYGVDGADVRWFQADQGQAVPFYISKGGDADLGEEATIALVQQAMDAWNNVPGSSLRLVYAGTTDPAPLGDCGNPKNIIVFNDPYGEASRAGRGGITEPCAKYPADPVVINGVPFVPLVRAGIVLGGGQVNKADPFNGTDLLAGAVTHELGHAIGLYHSSDDPNEGDQNLRIAIMYGAIGGPIIFGAYVYPDDENGLLKIYGHGETVPYWTCETERFLPRVDSVRRGGFVNLFADGLLGNTIESQCTRQVKLVLPTPHQGLRYLRRSREFAPSPQPGVAAAQGFTFKVTKKRGTPFTVMVQVTFNDGTAKTFSSKPIDPALIW